MDFDYTEDQKLLRDMIRRFGRDAVEPLRTEMDEKEAIPESLWKEAAGLGLLGLGVPETHGGSGTSLLTQVVVAEELGRASASLAVAAAHHAFLLPALLLACGSEAQRSKWLPDLTSGAVPGTVFANDIPLEAEDGGAPGGGIAAAPDGGGWRLKGRAAWVVSGQSARVCGLFAGEAGACLVRPEAGGLESEAIPRKFGLRPVGFADWTLRDHPVDADARLAEGGPEARRGLRLLSDLFLAAVCVGLIQSCVDVSVEYAKERRQFGRPIGSFQLVQDLIARMVFDVEAARLLVHRAALEAEGRGLDLAPCAAAVARARSLASEAALRAGTDAVQVHGGYGFSAEYPAERLFRDARGLDLLAGGTGELLRVSAEPLLGGALSGPEA